MSTKDIHESREHAPPLGLCSSEGLGITATTERKMAWRGEVEDGAGWSGLVASKAEQRAEARQAALEKDAARYRWLKSRHGLTLRSEKQPNVWKRMDGTEFNATHSLAENGTQHAPADSLDALIDAAMLAARIRDA